MFICSFLCGVGQTAGITWFLRVVVSLAVYRDVLRLVFHLNALNDKIVSDHRLL